MTTMNTTLGSHALRALQDKLATANRDVAARYPVDAGRRQPVHTVYGGAHLFSAELPAKLGKVALGALERYGGDPASFARGAGFTDDPRLAEIIHGRVVHKLTTEPIEDFRIDFEDGFGNRPDAEEDETAREAARQVARGLQEGSLPPFLGIRIKPLSDELAARSLRTLDLFITELADKAGAVPENFVITLPKITSPVHVEALADALDALEDGLGLGRGAIPLELMIEVTQSIVGPDGQVVLPALLDAARGRCVAAHFGTYDYTAACQITAAHQHMTHPACDFARHMMQIAYAGRGIWLSDGATNIMPVPPHRAAADDPPLSEAQLAENRDTVHAAWRLHVEHIHHSLVHGTYQGWDLHPAQLPTRYAAVYAFFLEGLEAASTRLRNFVEQAAQATLVGDVFDDAATGQGLLNFFLRGVSCGAITEEEALATGLTLEELRGRSFVKVLENRRAAATAPA